MMKRLALLIALLVASTSIFANNSLFSQSTLTKLILNSYSKSQVNKNIVIVYGGRDINHNPIAAQMNPNEAIQVG